MRIAINCRSMLSRKRTGVGRYTSKLIEYLQKVDQSNAYALYAPRKFLDFRVTTPRLSAGNFRFKHDHFKAGAYRTLGPVDLYHAPSPETLTMTGCKIVVTVHDLIYKTFPQGHTASTVETSEKQFREITRRADKIICCSQSTRRDLHEHFKIPESRSCVIYQGVDRNLFYPMDKKPGYGGQWSLKAKGIVGPYILFVGTIEPRKNLVNLLEAFSIVKERRQFSGQLVVVGMKGWMSDDLQEFVGKLKVAPHVRFLGYVPDDELRILYNRAEVLVFPSFYEGFGFPIVEAMSCGTPVVTSNTSSCQEVAGEAALTVSPRSPLEIAQAILRIIEDRNFRAALIEKGLKRSEHFSFLTTAQETFKVYQEVGGIR
jgi:glycosyltransferase involved in cell wall biosynthesis